jgi:hypothetical protein
MIDTTRRLRTLLLLTLAGAACSPPPDAPAELAATHDELLEELIDELPNGFPIPNPAGAAATHSSEGAVDLDDTFHTPQGANGRHCATCHAVESGWSITPAQVALMFALTDGKHPIFNSLDANNPAADTSTTAARSSWSPPPRTRTASARSRGRPSSAGRSAPPTCASSPATCGTIA